MNTTKALIAREFLIGIGVNNPPIQNSSNPLGMRVSRSYNLDNKLELQAAILFRHLQNLVELEALLRDYDLDAELKADFLGQLSRLRTYLSPAHWESDTSQWYQDIGVILKGLSQIHAIIRGTDSILLLEPDVLSSAADSLEAALEELNSYNDIRPAKKAKLLQTISLLIQFLRNSKSIPIDDAAEMFISAIWALAELKAKSGNQNLFVALIGALLLANTFVSDVRDVPENIKFLSKVAITISKVVKMPALLEPKPMLALPPPNEVQVDE